MDINEIRRISLEYAKGNMRTRRARKKKKAPRTYAEWFALSLQIGHKAGPPPDQGSAR